ncbi:MAG: DUF1353 domain-containing protein [Thiobacillaceae bacterium]|jgi:hypothetical protein|nr:DUF1353 domain-containing protein [Thiobacillaceae bacterium]
MNIAPGFLTQLVAEKVKEGGSYSRTKWKLRQDLAFMSETAGLIVAEEGFEMDFASVPRLPLTFWLTGDTAHASAVIHDKLCRDWVPRGWITWAGAAEVFREAMEHEGVPAWRRWLMYQGVLGADPAKKPWDHAA